jgi:SAM-dependent methyltransferase
MNIQDLISKTQKPKIYEKGTAFMWTDEHISKQLLDVHLNPDVDLASRKKSAIEKTANWILDTQKEKGRLSILDLGCGPGLYAERFAEKGHQVTGVDISKNSIEYAERSARKKKLDISYLNSSYLDIDLEPDQYDLVVLIYTDLGVLLPAERERLLNLVFRVLKKDGTFIFDVLSDKDLEKKIAPKTWDIQDQGFWNGSPYLVLSESFLYPEEKVILYQHTVADEDNTIEIYRFWTHFFSQNDVTGMLKNFTFMDVRFREDILPEGDLWSGDHVLFTMASKG